MFTDNHRHYLQNMLRHVEHEVQEAVDLLHGGDPDTLFPRYRDFPAQERIDALHAHQARLRAAMRRFMDTWRIPYPGDSAIEAIRGYEARLALVRNAAYELRPRYVLGYGPLDAGDEQACRALAAELGALLDAMAGELRRGPLRLPGDGSGDALLDTLADIVDRHRLLEYRSRIEALLARGQEDRVEVALLGRVSSGKSSLVNALLGQPLLPVGAVPVTTVVTRLRHDTTTNVRAVDVDGQVQAIAPGELHDYIDEAGNPGNRRRLREVDVGFPAPILEHGVVLTDTPGLGSLHASASAHALDYLPRCDLGIVAIDAAATLMPQDLDLLRALRDGGADWLVVLTKADAVASDALAQQRSYVERTLAEALQLPVTVDAVSVQAGHCAGFEQWRDEVLRPKLEHAAAQAGARHRQRILDLTVRAHATLQQALAEQPEVPASTEAARSHGSALADLDERHRRLHDLVRDLDRRGAEAIIEEAVTQAPPGIALDAGDMAARAASLADAVVRDILGELRGVAGRLDQPAATQALRGVPPFGASPAAASVSTGAALLPWRRPQLRSRLRNRWGADLQRDFSTYAVELNHWLDQAVRQLRRHAMESFEGEAAPAAVPDRAMLEADLGRLDVLLAGDAGAMPAGATRGHGS
jgi:GTP-binding protein EngB required for normal cell division